MAYPPQKDDEFGTPVLLNLDDPRLSAPPQPPRTPQQEEEAFFVDPVENSSDYLRTRAEVSGHRVNDGGFEAAPEPAAPSVLGAEQPQPPFVLDAGAAFPVPSAPDTGQLSPDTAPAQKPSAGIEGDDVRAQAESGVLGATERPRHDLPPQAAADRALDEKMGWGYGGAALVRGVEELQARDAAAAMPTPDPSSRISQLLGGNPAQAENQLSPAIASRISAALDGGTPSPTTRREAPAGLPPSVGGQLGEIAARLSGGMNPDGMGDNTALPPARRDSMRR